MISVVHVSEHLLGFEHLPEVSPLGFLVVMDWVYCLWPQLLADDVSSQVLWYWLSDLFQSILAVETVMGEQA